MRTHREALAQPLQWEEFGEREEEALAFSAAARRKPEGDAHDFEFWISAGGGLLPATAGATMCSADEVFFQGQILPLRPSRCFAANRSSSNGSRSPSSSSARSISAFDPPQLSWPLSRDFYAHPSPKPHLRGVKRSIGRRSASSAPGGAGWRIFRLGVVGAPEIELYDLKYRQRTIKKSGAGGFGRRRSDADASSHAKFENKAAAASRLVGLGLSCKCSPAAEDPIPPGTTKVMAAKKKEEGVSLRRESSVRRHKIIGWLEELSIAKVTGRRDPVMSGFCSGF